MSDARAHPPVLPAPVEARLPTVRRHTLDAGVQVFTVRTGTLPVVDVRAVVRAGAAWDPPTRAGRAFLTAELLDEGTATRSALDIAEETEALGASLSARAAWHHTTIGLHVLSPRLDAAMELLADILVSPAFHDADFQRKRDERCAAIRQDLDEPRVVASQAFVRAVYGLHHPYGAPPGGTLDSVPTLSADDVREFHHRHYRPDTALLVIAGDIPHEDALHLADRHLRGWTGRAPPPPDLPPPPLPEPAAIRILDRPGAPQSEIRVGLAGPPRRSPDFFPLLVGNTVLGGSFTSRLNMRLREEKAYTYGASSHFAFRAAGGPFVATTAVHTAATADAVQEMVREIGRLGVERIGDEELDRARSYLVLGLPRTFETTSDIAEHVLELALHDLGSDWFDRYPARVRAVSAAAVQEAGARWLRPEQLSIVIAGDASAIRSDLESLGIGRVEVCA